MRVSLSPFLRGDTWWCRVPRLDAPAVQRSLGIVGKEHRDVAQFMCDFLRWLKGRRESFLLDQLALNTTTVSAAYTAFTENRLEQFIRDLREGVTDVDLEPFVAKWQRELERRKKPNAETRAKYLRQVRTLIPAGQPFRRSTFTKQRIRAWLGELTVAQPNRYRAALSSFAQFLLLEDVLVVNPVRHVPMAKEADPRSLHLSIEDAKRLVDAIEPEFRPLHALMLATGMEISAAVAVRRRDLDFARNTAYARGTKRITRERTCMIYERWLWAWEIVRTYVQAAPHLPESRVFARLTSEGSLDALRRALRAATLPDEYRQHDHRHTWAVQAVRDGLALHTIAAQLGHRDAMMVVRVYGRYRPDRSDFDLNVKDTATSDEKQSKNA